MFSNSSRIFLLMCAVLLIFGCKQTADPDTAPDTGPEVPVSDFEQLQSWMTGTYSSTLQAERDSNYLPIILHMYPIWKDNEEASWLYVEQALASTATQPYRQRVYRLSETDNTFESKVYELANPENFIGKWHSPEAFDSLTVADLVEREGCAVYLEKKDENYYGGSTIADECKSDFLGAMYATSEVTVYADSIVSWDRGWDENDNFLWGAEHGGYVFVKQ